MRLPHERHMTSVQKSGWKWTKSSHRFGKFLVFKIERLCSGGQKWGFQLWKYGREDYAAVS